MLRRRFCEASTVSAGVFDSNYGECSQTQNAAICLAGRKRYYAGAHAALAETSGAAKSTSELQAFIISVAG